MAANHENDSGESRRGPDPEYPRSAFIEVFENLEYPYVIGTNEVADAVGCQEQTAYRRLNELCEDGVICKRSIGRGQRLVWYLPEDGLE